MLVTKDRRLTELLSSSARTMPSVDEHAKALRSVAEEEAAARFSVVFDGMSFEVARAESQAERTRMGWSEEKSLVYGEIDFTSFVEVLRNVHPRPGGAFLDLGCGSGKAVIAAALLFDFARVRGVEVLRSLYNMAVRAKEAYESLQDMPQDVPEVQLLNMSFLDDDWSDADVVFANSTCFGDEVMAAIGEKCVTLKPGAFVITLTCSVPSDAVALVTHYRRAMSWGQATVYIHRRAEASPKHRAMQLELNCESSTAGATGGEPYPDDDASPDEGRLETSFAANDVGAISSPGASALLAAKARAQRRSESFREPRSWGELELPDGDDDADSGDGGGGDDEHASDSRAEPLDRTDDARRRRTRRDAINDEPTVSSSPFGAALLKQKMRRSPGALQI